MAVTQKHTDTDHGIGFERRNPERSMTPWTPELQDVDFADEGEYAGDPDNLDEDQGLMHYVDSMDASVNRLLPAVHDHQGFDWEGIGSLLQDQYSSQMVEAFRAKRQGLQEGHYMMHLASQFHQTPKGCVQMNIVNEQGHRGWDDLFLRLSDKLGSDNIQFIQSPAPDAVGRLVASVEIPIDRVEDLVKISKAMETGKFWARPVQAEVQKYSLEDGLDEFILSNPLEVLSLLHRERAGDCSDINFLLQSSGTTMEREFHDDPLAFMEDPRWKHAELRDTVAQAMILRAELDPTFNLPPAEAYRTTYDPTAIPGKVLEDVVTDLRKDRDRGALSEDAARDLNLLEPEFEERRETVEKDDKLPEEAKTTEAMIDLNALGEALTGNPARKAYKTAAQQREESLLSTGYGIGAQTLAQAQDLDEELFMDDQFYTEADRSLAQLTLDRAQETRPRMATPDPTLLLINGARAFRESFRQIKCRPRDASRKDIRADVVDDQGMIIKGAINWTAYLEYPLHNRGQRLEFVQPVIAGEPQALSHIIMSSGRKIPFSQEAIEEILHIRPVRHSRRKPGATTTLTEKYYLS